MTQPGRSPLDPWIDREIDREIDVEQPGGTPVGCDVQTRRTLLVDGFNVLHTVLLAGERDSVWWGREAREKLLARVCTWPDPRDEIWVAFDGAQPAWSVLALPAGRAAGGRGPMVHSVFVESADDWIVRRARRALPASNALVVSADRKVAGRARSAGCEVWTPWAFIAHCDSARTSIQLPADPDAPGEGEAASAPRPPPNVVS